MLERNILFSLERYASKGLEQSENDIKINELNNTSAIEIVNLTF